MYQGRKENINKMGCILLPRPVSVRGWTSAFLLKFDQLSGAIEGRLSHVLPRWLKTGWRSVISQGKLP